MANKMVASDTPKKSGSDDELLSEMRTNYQKDSDADAANRQKALADLRFANVPGNQWDQSLLLERGQDRPAYEFNKVRINNKRVVNDIRSNRPSGKVRATEDGDVEKAEIREGLIRNVLSNCDFDTILDNAVETQVAGGMGAWRVNTVLPDDEVYNQDVVVEGIRNPFCLYPDRHCQDPLKRDARHWTLTSLVGFDEFEATYGKKVEKHSFESSGFDSKETWITEDSVRVCEYWYKKPIKRTLMLLQDGRTLNAAKFTPEQLVAIQPSVVKSREVDSYDIYSCIASGSEILKGPTKWAGTRFPFVVIYGEYMVVDGTTHWYGLTRWGKDPQKAYNFANTSAIESVGKTPQAKYWMTPAQALGLQDSYAEAHRRNLPVAFYNPDPKQPGPPVHMGGADVPNALLALTMQASEDIKSTSGIFDNSLGKTANETSGIAIQARQHQGEIATYNFLDNATKGVQLTWELVGDVISAVYDGERTVRVLGQDGAEKFHRLNTAIIDPMTGQPMMDPLTGLPVYANDMSEGKFDYTVTSGPSFATQRQEAAETYSNLMQGNPALFPLIGDLVMKSTDLPYSEEIAARLKAMLPPQLQEQEDGKPLPPEAMQAMQQAAQAMQQVQAMTETLQKAQDETAQKSEEVQKQLYDLGIKRAELNVTFEKQMSQIVTAQAALDVSVAQAQAKVAGVDNSQQHAEQQLALSQQMTEGLALIQGQVTDYIQQAAATIAEMAKQNIPQVVVAPSPPASKRRSVRVKRVNGELVGEVVDVPDQSVSPSQDGAAGPAGSMPPTVQ